MAITATITKMSHIYMFENIPMAGFGVGVMVGLRADIGMKEELSLRMTMPPSSPDGLGVGVAVGPAVGVGVAVDISRSMRT